MALGNAAAVVPSTAADAAVGLLVSGMPAAVSVSSALSETEAEAVSSAETGKNV
jgi:hypothetical protein